MKIELNKNNEKAIKLIIKDFPSKKHTIENLANYYIYQYIINFFTDGKWYYKDIK